MKFKLLLLFICWGIATPAFGQVLPDYDLAGASKPKPDLSFRKENQYKRVHQSSLRLILRGQLDKTQTFLEQYLTEHSGDAETLYMLGILHGQRNQLAKSEDYMKRAIAAGLPEGRLIAGPREMLKPLADSALMKTLAAQYAHEPIHGPLVGNVTDSTASFWVRTGKPSNVNVLITNPSSGKKVGQSDDVKSLTSEDFTAVVDVSQLKPNHEYQYSVLIDGQPGMKKYSFRTLPPKAQPSKFVIAFGGGAGYVPENERMWNTIGAFDPQAILLLGDNVYIDDPESVIMQQYTYQRRQSRPEWRKLTARSPVFTIWDDHDFSTNDSWGGADIDAPGINNRVVGTRFLSPTSILLCSTAAIIEPRQKLNLAPCSVRYKKSG